MKIYLFFISLFLFPLFLSPKTLSQNIVCIDGDIKIGETNYSSIQSAIKEAENGDVISLGSGVFNEELNFLHKANITLSSECSPEIKKLTIRNSSSIVVRGLFIKASESRQGATLTLRNANSIRIEDSHILQSSSDGIRVRGGTDLLFSNLVVHNNKENGFSLEEGLEARIQNSRVYNNEQDGIFVDKVSSLIIEETEIYNNQRNGIITFKAGNSKGGFFGLRKVSIYSNGQNGILDRSNHTFRLSDSEITMNLKDGIRFIKPKNVKDNLIDSNQIHSNSESGLHILSGDNLDLIKNKFFKNQDYGVFLNATVEEINFHLEENQISNNNGQFAQAVHSKDLRNYPAFLNNEDTGNQTSLNNEGLGVGNYRPVANAGADILSSVGTRTRLSAENSYDLDGDSLSYKWIIKNKPQNSSAELENSNSAESFLSIDVQGDYDIELTVNDGRQNHTDQIRISTGNVAPLADAGPDQFALIESTVSLNSQSSDLNNQTLTHNWSFVKKPVGSRAEILNSSSVQAQFRVDTLGDYEIELTVSDGRLSSKDRLLVSTENIKPQVEIQTPSNLSLGMPKSLSVRVSDPNNDENITYKWSVLFPSSENSFNFSNVETKNTSFTPLQAGVYILQLRAFDGKDFSQDTLYLNIGNQIPIANAGSDITNILTNQRVNLSAKSSSDPEGRNLTYNWGFKSKPQNSMAVIGNMKKESAFFLPDKAGSYVLFLKVNDGFLESIEDTVTVTVSDPQNRVPVLNPIGNKTVSIGGELSFKVSGTDPDPTDNVSFTVTPLPLASNMSFNSTTGEFFFKPRAQQAGTYNLSFQAVDSFGGTDSENITITVPSLSQNATTTLTGQVLDAQSMVESNTKLPLVNADIRVLVDGSIGGMGTTNSNGYFTISNLPRGTEKIIQINTMRVTGPNNSRYGDFNEQIEVIEGADNTINRPFYMPRIDTAGVTTIRASQATKVLNTNINVQLDIPANTAMLNGLPYNGEISISQVPRALAPVALPEGLEGTAMLITIQPVGLTFTTPVPITFPNTDNLPAGSEMDIFSVDPSTGLFAMSARGRVNGAGTRIETISGGVTAATWHTPGGPSCNDECCSFESICKEPPNDDCETCQAGSSVDLLNGELRESHNLASYRSLNIDRSITLGYSSKLAHPMEVVSFERSYSAVNAIPQTVSSTLKITGFSEGKETFTSARELSQNRGEVFIQTDAIDLSSLSTGIYEAEQVGVSNYSVSRFSNTSVRDISVINAKNSPYGVGWSVANLQRIYLSEFGNVLLVSDNGFHAQFTDPVKEQERINALRLRFPIQSSVRAGPRRGSVLGQQSSQEVTYISPNGDYSILKRVSNGGYVRTMKNGMLYRFNSLGLLISEEDRNGNETIYCYYEGTSRLKCIKDPNGLEYTFSYGNDDLLASITDPTGRVTSFEHNQSGHLVRITDPDSSVREFSYNEKGLMTAQRDKRGNVSNYLYNSVYQVIQTIRPDGTGVSLQPQETMSLPKNEDEGTETSPLSIVLGKNLGVFYTNTNGNNSQFTLSERGQFIKMTDEIDRETNIERDDDGNIISFETPRDFHWTYTYDDRGNQTSAYQRETDTLSSYTYEADFSQITSITRPNADITESEYDSKGNLIKYILPDRSFYSFSYNRSGLMTRKTDPLGNITKYFYDRLSGNLIAIRDSLGNTTKFELDTAGNIIKMIDPNAHITTNEYDSLNRLTKTIDPESGESIYSYDKKGNLISLRDERGNTTSYTYDVLDRLIKRVNPLNETDTYTYDNEGYTTAWTNRKGVEISYLYDPANQLIQKTLGNEDIYSYGYDLDGNMSFISDSDSRVSYEYDGLDRMIRSSTEDSPKQPEIIQLYEYDKNNNRISLRAGFSDEDEDNFIENSYTYDVENQLTTLSSIAGKFRFQYDDLSRMTEMTYPNGIISSMSYEGDSRLSKLEYKLAGKTQNLFSYRYDDFNNKKRMKTFRGLLPVSSPIHYNYDEKDQLLSATNPLRALAGESFTYDLSGNRLRRTGQSSNSIYNNNNQLTEDEDYNYSYDSNGNLIQKVHKRTMIAIKYKWDIENRLIQVTKHTNENALPNETVTYSYDALDRRIEKNVNGDIKRYVYDNEDILMEFDGDNVFQKFYVHGLGIDEPLAMVEENKETRADTEDLKVHYYHKDGMGSIISLTDEEGKEKEKYIYNAFGKVTIYDEDNKQIQSSLLKNPYTFTGREYDSETDLHYHRARYYNPETGTWISEDPIEFDSGDQNLYRYVFNNPVNLTDFFGDKIFDCYRDLNIPFSTTRTADRIAQKYFDSDVAMHQYFCIDNAEQPSSCKGFYKKGIVREEDPLVGNPVCFAVGRGDCPSEIAFDNCVWRHQKTGEYHARNYNCQDFVNEAIEKCQENCNQ